MKFKIIINRLKFKNYSENIKKLLITRTILFGAFNKNYFKIELYADTSILINALKNIFLEPFFLLYNIISMHDYAFTIFIY